MLSTPLTVCETVRKNPIWLIPPQKQLLRATPPFYDTSAFADAGLGLIGTIEHA